MTRDPWLMAGVGCFLTATSALAWVILDPPGCVRRYQAARRRRADRGWVHVR
jgi:hypothetical protein